MFSGSIRAIITGIAATTVLIAVLAASRLFRVMPEQGRTEIVEVSTYIPPEEEPPMEESEEEPEEQELVEELSPPIPALDLIVAPHLDAPALPVSAVKFNPHMTLDIMIMDRAPAGLPTKKIARPLSRPKVSNSSRPKTKPTVRPRSKPVVKAYYKSNELDGKPREIRQGSFTWPSRARGRSGLVTLNVEISSSGRVTVLGVRSSTNPALNASAEKLARTSRFTSPKKNGRPVKARFSKTYKLIKPR